MNFMASHLRLKQHLMNRTLILVFFLMMGVASATAQHPLQMPQEGAIYREYCESYDPSNWPYIFKHRYQYLVQGDTNINGLAYKMLHETNYGDNIITSEFIGGMRSDSSGKVFVWMADSMFLFRYSNAQNCHAQECLLFDFSLNVGDTISVHNHWSQFVVLQKDTITISGQPRLRFSLSGQEVIEGVGWIRGLFHPLTQPFELSVWLSCYSDSNIFYSPMNLNQQGCLSVSVGNDHDETELRVFPNPSSNYLFVDVGSGEALRGGTLQVFDARGTLLSQQRMPADGSIITISTASYPTGLYFGRITTADNSRVFRFVVERE